MDGSELRIDHKTVTGEINKRVNLILSGALVHQFLTLCASKTKLKYKTGDQHQSSLSSVRTFSLIHI